MKIYTRTGDSGSTGLFGGPRVPKDDERIEAYGTVDELNAVIGSARAAGVDADPMDDQLAEIQHELFAVGAELATPDPDARQMRLVSGSHIERLETWIDAWDDKLPELKHFILPAGDSRAASLHLARAVCRRAERRVVTLARGHESGISQDLLVYLNRLSDYLFVASRAANQAAGCDEVHWVRPGKGG